MNHPTTNIKQSLSQYIRYWFGDMVVRMCQLLATPRVSLCNQWLMVSSHFIVFVVTWFL